jgi:hypothetical protein
MNAAWPYAGHTVLDVALPDAPRCSSRWTTLGDAALEDEDTGHPTPKAAAVAAITTRRPARRIRVIRGVVVRAGSR